MSRIERNGSRERERERKRDIFGGSVGGESFFFFIFKGGGVGG